MKLMILFVVLSACSVPVTLHKTLALSGKEQPSSEKCRECHTAIYDEWKSSTHSRAYTNPFFRSITNEYMVSVCVNCHSPESVFSQEILQRQTNIEEGVNCQSCHLLNGVLQGPVEKHLPFDIHPIMELNQDYLKSSICGNCHRKAFEEFRKSGEKERTCQGCHMPAVRRTIINNKPWVWLKSNYEFREHSFSIRETKEVSDLIEIKFSVKDTSTRSGEVVIKNKSIPHNVPTGGYGYHEVILVISLIDNMGESMEKITYSMTQEMQTSLKSGEARIIPFIFSDKGRSPMAIRVSLVKTDFERKHMMLLSKKTLNLR